MTLRVDLLTRDQAQTIDFQHWDQLAESSVFTNPFFERWSLSPALEHLQKKDKVLVVAAYQQGQLIALFPVVKKQHRFGINFLSMWNHEHCFLCDPLCSQPQLLGEIVNNMLNQCKVNVFRVEEHSQKAFGDLFESQSVNFYASRGAIFKTRETRFHLATLPQKIRQENKRISKRFFEKTGASYETNDRHPEIDWLGDYLHLEHTGWKGKVHGSILSDIGVEAYYQALFRNGMPLNKIRCQGLYTPQGPIAVSVRLVSNERAFDIKTTFDETYRELYPGVNLELRNILDLENYQFEFVDSCTVSTNYLINRLWPDQRKILTSVYFKTGLTSWLLKKIYRLKSSLNLES